MLYKLITGNKNLTVFIIFLICLIIRIPSFFSDEARGFEVQEIQMPFHSLLIHLLQGNVLLSRIIAFIFVLIQSFLLYRINLRFVLIQKRTYLPFLLFVVLTGFIPELHSLNEVLIASLFIILATGILMSSNEAESNSYKFFDAGLMIGLGMMFYSPMIYFLIYLWISTSVLRSFYWREYVYPVLGIIIPVIFYLAWLFLNDLSLIDFFERFGSSLFNGFPEFTIDWPGKLFIAYSALIILLSSIYMLRVFQFRKVYIRSYFMMLFWLFVISMMIFVLVSGFYVEMIYIISIPVTFIMTYYFTTNRESWLNKVLLYLLILGPILVSVARITGWL